MSEFLVKIDDDECKRIEFLEKRNGVPLMLESMIHKAIKHAFFDLGYYLNDEKITVRKVLVSV
jgi:hypothetical protein